ncbi:phenylacetate--CoA ligase family protein [Patescibacteria group bacterium]
MKLDKFNKNIFSNTRELKAFQKHHLNLVLVSANKSKFYKEKLKNEKINLKNITMDDLSNIPTTTKKELLINQKKYSEIGNNFSINKNKFYLIKPTSGTTNNPLIMPYTKGDFERRGLYSGPTTKYFIKPNSTDRVLFLFTPGAFHYEVDGYREAGIKSVPPLINEYANVKQLVKYKVTIIQATLTNIIKLTEAAQEMGINLKTESKVHSIYCGGEIGSNNKHIHVLLEKIWNAKIYTSAGSSECGKFTCQCKKSEHAHLYENSNIIEVIDPKTKQPSNKGLLVLTPLWRQDYPLLRYETGDLVEIISERCSCGSIFRKLKNNLIERIGSKLTLNKKTYSHHEIDAFVRKLVGLSEYKLTAKKSNKKDIIELTLEQELPIKRRKIINIKNKLSEHLNTKVNIKLVPYKWIRRSEWKASRIIDSRKPIKDRSQTGPGSNQIKYFFHYGTQNFIVNNTT